MRRMHGGDRPDKPNFSVSTPFSPPAEDSSRIPDKHEAQAKTDEHLDAGYVTAEPARLRSAIEALTKEMAELDQQKTVLSKKKKTLEDALEILENLT
jgi:hypothetical protein